MKNATRKFGEPVVVVWDKMLATLPAPAAAAALAEAFEGKRTPKRVEQIQRQIETLAALGQAEEVQPGLWGR